MADHYLQRKINSLSNTGIVDRTADIDASFSVPAGATFQVLRKTDGVDSTLTLPTTGFSDGDTLTVVMLQRDGLGNYDVACLQGTVTFAAIYQVATFRYQTDTTVGWTLVGAPYGATVA